MACAGRRAMFFVLVALAALGGCDPPDWHFAIVGFDPHGNPRFCVTERPGCTGDGVWLSMFDVEEWPIPPPPPPKVYRGVWGLRAISKERLREFSYGVAPPGYRQSRPAEPLVPGRIYLVDFHWFRLRERDGQMEYQVGHWRELVDCERNGWPKGCPPEVYKSAATSSVERPGTVFKLALRHGEISDAGCGRAEDGLELPQPLTVVAPKGVDRLSWVSQGHELAPRRFQHEEELLLPGR